MDAARKKVIRRIIALSQVGPKNATPGEVENAERAGKRLIERHEIRLAEVQAVHREDAIAEAERLRGKRPPAPPVRDYGTPPRPGGAPGNPFGFPSGQTTTGTGSGSFVGNGWTIYVQFD